MTKPPFVLGVLVSGSGTNLQAILDAVADARLKARVGVVISNVGTAKALDRAKGAKVPAIVVDHKSFATREAFDTTLVDVLRSHHVDCVVLAGFMRLVTPTLLGAFPNRVVNVHPALLPAFPGVHAQRQALAYGVKVTGCTVHLVDAGMDTGPILAQATVPVNDDDDEAALTARILEREHELLPHVLELLAEGRIDIETHDNAGNALPRPRVRVVA